VSPAPILLEASFHETTWGAHRLSPWFPDQDTRIGEVWFSLPSGEPLPLLVKFLFTTGRLSVQVHPDDAYALEHEGHPGKSEMWYVLAAEPGAVLAAGFREPVTRARVREAAMNGDIEQLLRWWPVRPGQVYYVPAGTVHTLGAGITVCEIQQNNPVTYRLYDYGRPRELHLDQALDVLRLDSHPGPVPAAGERLVSCPHFVTDRLEVTGLKHEPEAGRWRLLIVLEGKGALSGRRMAPGQVWYVPAGVEPLGIVASERAVLLRTSVPS